MGNEQTVEMIMRIFVKLNPQNQEKVLDYAEQIQQSRESVSDFPLEHR